jgi:hypothetical protein
MKSPPAPRCARCSYPFPANPEDWRTITQCPRCDAPIQVTAFPKLGKTIETGREGENILIEGESACFYHANKRAVVPCDKCGRFLCALCDIQFGASHLCSQCLDSANKKGTASPVEVKRIRYDQIVFALAILPLVLCLMPAFVTAPLAIAISIWKWNAPVSLVARTRPRFVAATVLAFLELAAVTTWTIFIFKR